MFHRFLILIVSVFAFTMTSAKAEDWGDLARLKAFIEVPIPLTSLPVMESMKLSSHDLKVRPWSDSYWPDRSGSIANAYAKGGSLNMPISWWLSKVFDQGRYKRQRNWRSMDEQELSNLSPSEKYDVLLGDDSFSLTNGVFGMIQALSDKGKTAIWSGVCHGWSPASLALPRPLHSFSIPLADGRTLAFYPADVKALASFLWGKSFAQDYVKLEGNHCKGGMFPKEDHYGRLLDPKCFDVNPAFFHLALVNLVGLHERGFIMDRSYKDEVQNQPIYGYTYTFFNESRRNVTPLSLQEAKTPLASFKDDYYARHRSPRAVSIVGVQLEVRYANESKPFHLAKDGPEYDQSDKITFRYDLELDAQDNIVGGEWIKHLDMKNFDQVIEENRYYTHPDIIWLPGKTLKAFSVADQDLNGSPWNLLGEAPQSWRNASAKAAQLKNLNGFPHPQPLGRLVDLLIRFSRQ